MSDGLSMDRDPAPDRRSPHEHEAPAAQPLTEIILKPAARPSRPPAPPPAPPRLDRLRLPASARALLALGGDGAVIAARPEAAAGAGRRIARAVRLAAAALQRAGLGALRRAIVEDAEEAHFLRADATLTLAVALPRATHVTQGLLEINRLWAAAQHELAVARDAVAGPTASASARRVS